MRYYQVYRQENRQPIALKIGFSYPGFLFSCFWAYSKKLWARATIALLITLILPIAVYLLVVFHAGESSKSLLDYAYYLYQHRVILTLGMLCWTILALSAQIYFGFFGNDMVAISLTRKGYQRTPDILPAKNAKDALRNWQTNTESTGTKLPDRLALWWKGTLLTIVWIAFQLWNNGLDALIQHHPEMPKPSVMMANTLTPAQLLQIIRHSPHPAHRKDALMDLRAGAHHAMPGDEARWGVILLHGQYGVAKNVPRGIHWLRVSATAGDALGLEQLGMLAAKGVIPGGFPAAKLWFTHAAREGSYNAIEYLGYWPWHLLEHLSYHSPAALQQLRAGARKGDAVAEYYYAMSYRLHHPQGNLPTSEREKKAVYWYRKSACQHFGYAEYELGQSYYDGRGGLPKNIQKADHWWKLAAMQGDKLAANNVGYSYQIGAGVPKNDILAAAWFLSSSVDGYQPARAKADALMAKMTSKQKADVMREYTTLESPLKIIHQPKG